LWIDLDRTYRVPEFSAEGDFAERLMSLSQRLINEYKPVSATGTGSASPPRR
jgi:hypothetical protein